MKIKPEDIPADSEVSNDTSDLSASRPQDTNGRKPPDGDHKHYRKILGIAAKELKGHLPFTIIGAFTGILLIGILVIGDYLHEVHEFDQAIFFGLHPSHVFLSALVTTSLYMRYGKKKIWIAVIVGITGSLGIATLSDSIIPFIGEMVLGLPHAHAHIGLIEEPILTIPPAILGVVLGCFLNATRFPHLGHVLLSTWASLFHMIMALGESVELYQLALMFVFLFLAVWLPCCVSDIIWPLLFMKKGEDIEDCLVCSHGHD